MSLLSEIIVDIDGMFSLDHVIIPIHCLNAYYSVWLAFSVVRTLGFLCDWLYAHVGSCVCVLCVQHSNPKRQFSIFYMHFMICFNILCLYDYVIIFYIFYEFFCIQVKAYTSYYLKTFFLPHLSVMVVKIISGLCLKARNHSCVKA